MKRDQPERRLQITIVNAFRDILPPDVWFCHIPNGGKRNAFEAKRLKAAGVRAGAPDLCIVYQGEAYFMELKIGRGKLSDAQTECRAALRRASAFVETVRSLDEALECLAIWNIPTRIKQDIAA